jgi:hypothetical protein
MHRRAASVRAAGRRARCLERAQVGPSRQHGRKLLSKIGALGLGRQTPGAGGTDFSVVNLTGRQWQLQFAPPASSRAALYGSESHGQATSHCRAADHASPLLAWAHHLPILANPQRNRGGAATAARHETRPRHGQHHRQPRTQSRLASGIWPRWQAATTWRGRGRSRRRRRRTRRRFRRRSAVLGRRRRPCNRGRSRPASAKATRSRLR